MSVITRLVAAALACAVLAAPVAAEPVPAAPAAPARVIAVAPLATLGAEDTSVATRKLTSQLEAALAQLPGATVVTAQAVAQAITRAKKPQLKLCDRDPRCLTELGKLVGATVVIDGEVGGLGESQVVYLGATDVTTGKEIRSTTLSIGGKGDTGGGPAGAAVRLLEPDRYRGILHLAIDATGATVYINGTKVALGPASKLSLPVGTQAVRVTHPQYRDFVRFIDVPYDQTTEVPVAMTQYPVLQHDLAGKPVSRDRVVYVDPPVWRRWYVVAPVAIGLAVIAGAIAASYAGDWDSDACRKVGGGACPD